LATYPLHLVHSEFGTPIKMPSSGQLGPRGALLLAIIAVNVAAYSVVKLERYPRYFLAKVLGITFRKEKPAAADLP